MMHIMCMVTILWLHTLEITFLPVESTMYVSYSLWQVFVIDIQLWYCWYLNYSRAFILCLYLSNFCILWPSFFCVLFKICIFQCMRTYILCPCILKCNNTNRLHICTRIQKLYLFCKLNACSFAFDFIPNILF